MELTVEASSCLCFPGVLVGETLMDEDLSSTVLASDKVVSEVDKVVLEANEVVPTGLLELASVSDFNSVGHIDDD